MAARQPRKLTVEKIVVMQSMFAARNLRGQRDRLLDIQAQVNQTPGDYPIEEVIAGLAAVLFDGLKIASLYLTVCLDKAAESGALLAPSPSFSDLRQLVAALVAAQRLPARPTTQAEAYSRIQAALYAVVFLQEHVLPPCIDRLITATVQWDGGSMAKPRALLDRACAIVDVAIEHVDLAVAAISRFVHPREVASDSRFADRCTNFGWSELDLMIKRLFRERRPSDLRYRCFSLN